jgi:signal transduction histidine kinase
MQAQTLTLVAGITAVVAMAWLLLGRGHRLKDRLFRRLILVALLPTLVVSSLAVFGYSQALRILEAPGLTQPTEAGLELARHYLAALEGEAQRVLAIWDSRAQGDPGRAASLPLSPGCVVLVVADAGGETLWRSRPQPTTGPEPSEFPSLPLINASDLPWSGRRAAGDRSWILAARSTRWEGAPGVVWWVQPVPEPASVALLGVQEGSRGLQQLQLYYGSLLRKQGLAVAALVLIALVLLSLWLSHRLAGRLARPLAELSAATRRVAAGQRGLAFPTAASDELGDLQRSFEEMTLALDHSEKELRRTERLAAWQQVARRLAHEIKNPLTPIHLAVHRMRSKSEDAALREGLDVILEETAQLERLAQEFSTFARLPRPRMQAVDFAEVFDRAHQLYAHDRRVERSAAVESLMVLADEGQLSQVLGNLVKNAVEASPGGGALHLRCNVEGSSLVFEIEDEGAGPPVESDRIFEPDFTTKSAGTGLGLPICRRIVEDHGGSIELVVARGSGACFRLRWPLATERDL